MKKLVIDNSVLIPVFLPESESLNAQAILSSDQYDCMAPAFLGIEFSNVLTAGLRTQRLTQFEVCSHLNDFKNIPIKFVRFPEIDEYITVIGIAKETGLSFYDAVYVALAIRENADLATYDKKMHTVAREQGVRVV